MARVAAWPSCRWRVIRSFIMKSGRRSCALAAASSSALGKNRRKITHTSILVWATPARSSAPIALRYSVSIRAWAHMKLIRQIVPTATWTELESSNALPSSWRPQPTSARRHRPALSGRLTVATNDPSSAGCKRHDGRTSDDRCARPAKYTELSAPWRWTWRAAMRRLPEIARDPGVSRPRLGQRRGSPTMQALALEFS
jgi:hypothetical protein